ncbi:MAG: Phage-related protein [Candidatus Nomurabacteria bacterium GW2011_GWB1_37_5]|uniref:Phage-related protein n=1 Tax=Candidatus Nomurabacteria bacterium GW2011_GWB1_37_5 TaxID=1618742 RepID=A0A0G0JAY7_9BACT|nr:MAG: Phage-related protein [Candidatus Nomurabacteria bacterium GW2011_GWB1_37_5]
MAWTVKFFQTERGKSPIEDFIKDQDDTTYAKILHLILLLKNNGPFLKPPYIKKLQSGLYELRTTGKVAVRIFYTMINNEYYLLHAFKKKTNKTPVKEIKIVLDRIKELI